MKPITVSTRRLGKASRNRAAVRVLRKKGFTWDGTTWQAPPAFITLNLKTGDIDKLRHALTKEPAAAVRLMPYVEKYMRKATPLHQIAEPGQSKGGCKP